LGQVHTHKLLRVKPQQRAHQPCATPKVNTVRPPLLLLVLLLLGWIRCCRRAVGVLLLLCWWSLLRQGLLRAVLQDDIHEHCWCPVVQLLCKVFVKVVCISIKQLGHNLRGAAGHLGPWGQGSQPKRCLHMVRVLGKLLPAVQSPEQ
jgi:hypothetical protein